MRKSKYADLFLYREPRMVESGLKRFAEWTSEGELKGFAFLQHRVCETEMALRDQKPTYSDKLNSPYEKWMFHIKQGGTAGILKSCPGI